VTGWFRANRRGAGKLALFALAIQLVVSFGHIHLPPALAHTGTPVAAAAITLDGDPAGPVGKHHPASDAFCDICAALSLAAHGQLSAPPALALPVFAAVPPAPAASTAAPLQRRHARFQSRGPPAV
jgi:hypothetical protein